MNTFPVFFPEQPTLFSEDATFASIAYDSNHEQCYIPSPVNGSIKKYYLTFTDSIAENTMVYDYFNSSEIFIHLPKNNIITSVLPTFFVLDKKYFSVSSKLSYYPSDLGYKPYSFATTVLSPTNSSSFAWSFSLSSFFNTSYSPDHPYYTSKNQKSTSFSIPVCSFYSIKNDSLDITSSSFKFANKIPNYHFCSNAELTESSSVCSCIFAQSYTSQSSCRFYSPANKTLITSQISVPNTSNSFNISLQYSLSIDGFHLFTIMNELNSDPISVLSYPSTVDATYENILQEVFDIYNEYLSCYEDHQPIDSNKDKQTQTHQKSSFIQSLLEV